MQMRTKRIGIIIENFLIQNKFHFYYNKMKEMIFSVSGFDEVKNSKDSNFKSFWVSLEKNNIDAFKFYQTIKLPNVKNKEFDITYDKYFYDEEHKKRFFNDFGFLIYSSKMSNDYGVNLVNIAQKELCDIVLIIGTESIGKLHGILSSLSKTKILFKELIIINDINNFKDKSYLKTLKKEKKLIDIYNPYLNKLLRINNKDIIKNSLEWFMNIEKRIG